MICKHILLTFLNKPELFFFILYTVKWFQVFFFLSNMSNSIYY